MRAKMAFAAVILMAGTLFADAAAPPPDQWTRSTTRGLTAWVDVEFRGADHTFVNDMPDISSTGMARMISSLRPDPARRGRSAPRPTTTGDAASSRAPCRTCRRSDGTTSSCPYAG